jgi:hypothetical protein
LLDTYEAAAVQLASLAEEADNDSVRVAAISRRVDLTERRITTLAGVGMLPRTWRGWDVAISAARDLEAKVREGKEHRGSLE